MNGLYERLQETTEYLKTKTELKPKVGVILGTGLGNFRDVLNIETIVSYEDIPNFAKSTVESHKGNLIFGDLGETDVVVMEGRFHYYEGYSLEEVTFPIRVMKELGVEILVITNASGGMNVGYEKGSVVFIEDHLNLTGQNPLIGVSDERLGCRFPDMCEPYSPDLIEKAEKVAVEEGFETARGVYAWVTGPCLETKAEYTFMNNAGADLVGMSTVPEVIVGVQCDLKILGISCVTDMCIPSNLTPVNIQEIVEVAERTGPKIDRIIKRFIEDLS